MIHYYLEVLVTIAYYWNVKKCYSKKKVTHLGENTVTFKTDCIFLISSSKQFSLLAIAVTTENIPLNLKLKFIKEQKVVQKKF